MLYRIKKPIIRRLALVKVPASGHRFHLFKSSPAPGEIIQPTTPNWRVAYTVVAEPGKVEDGGITSDGTVAKGEDGQPIQDVWDEQSIREAAHSWARNGGLTVDAHFTDGQTLGRWAETYIAPVDHHIEGRQIKAGSWILGIEPTPAGRAAIERGEIRGVSVEGSADREVVKAAAPAVDLDGVRQMVEACASAADAGGALAGLAASLNREEATEMAKGIDNELALREHLEAKVARAEQVVRERQQTAALLKSSPEELIAGLLEHGQWKEIRDRAAFHHAEMRARPKHATSWMYPEPTATPEQAADLAMAWNKRSPVDPRPAWAKGW